MRYSITVAPEAQEDFRSLSAYDRAAVRDAINHHLPHEPMRESKSRIKRLREMMTPQYGLRGGDFRVFYDGFGLEVEVLAIVDKVRAAEWLEKWGIRS